MPRPNASEYAPYHEGYISLATGDSPAALVRTHAAAIHEFYNALPDNRSDFAYGPGKWTLKEVLQHVIDSERIFAYRLLRISRGDKTPLPPFEQEDYNQAVAPSLPQRSLGSLKEEFNALRQSTDLLLSNTTPGDFARTGTVNHFTPLSANSLAFILYGHMIHHQHILAERYLG